MTKPNLARAGTLAVVIEVRFEELGTKSTAILRLELGLGRFVEMVVLSNGLGDLTKTALKLVRLKHCARS